LSTFSGKSGGVWGETPPNLTVFEFQIERIFGQAFAKVCGGSGVKPLSSYGSFQKVARLGSAQ
jgi:hypothetical protein